MQRLRRVWFGHLHLPSIPDPRHRGMRACRADRRTRHHHLQSQGRPCARRGHEIPCLQRAQAPGRRRCRGPVFRAHRMCRRGAGCPIPAVDAGCGALARPEADRPLRLHERYEARCADQPGHRNRRTRAHSRQSGARRRPCGNRGKEGRRLLYGRAAARPDQPGRPFAREILRGAAVSLANPETSAALSLLNARAVRERAHRMLALGLEDKLPNVRIDLDRMDSTVDLVLEVTRKAYPSFEVPFHSRWRHFVMNGDNRWADIADQTEWPGRAARARAEFDLAIVSVFLDAGAGSSWRYRDPKTGSAIGRSEGLGLASLAMFAGGAFSADPLEPLRVDADVLANFTVADLERGMQVSDINPLVGIDGRVDLLRRLGTLVASKPDIFGSLDTPRPGGLFDRLAKLADSRELPAPTILTELLHQLGPIWPSRLTLGGIALGDCWRHPVLTTADATSGLVPLHKLSQWLAYSLIEPLQTAGIRVTDIDALTGLAEYRNGGLFVDIGMLALRDPEAAQQEHGVASPLVVEWRALTVALLDRVADGLRHRLKVDATLLPLAKILEGGTWAAGRLLARQRRADASPPVKVISDGTVF